MLTRLNLGSAGFFSNPTICFHPHWLPNNIEPINTQQKSIETVTLSRTFGSVSCGWLLMKHQLEKGFEGVIFAKCCLCCKNVILYLWRSNEVKGCLHYDDNRSKLGLFKNAKFSFRLSVYWNPSFPSQGSKWFL